MQRRTTALLLTAAALPLLALPAAADHAPEAVALGASTTVLTAGSAVVDVVLHDDARVSTDPDAPGVRFEGAGRLLGVWLQAADGPGDFLVSSRLPAFAGGEQATYGSGPVTECEPVPDERLPLTSDCAGSAPGQEAVLRAGRYVLTVLADDAPVAVRLDLRGLDEDAVTVRPTRRLASVQQSLPVLEQVGSELVTFGAAADLGAPVQTFVLARATAGDASLVREASSCQRDDEGAAPLAYGPHCPGGASGGYAYSALGLSGAGAFGSSSSTPHTGAVGLGGSFGDSSGVQLEDALGVWLEQH